MSTTASLSSPLVRGVLAQTQDKAIVLTVPGSNYRLHLTIEQPLAVAIGKPVSGQIFARVRRVDKVQTGGRYIEPLFGRPRRLQGAVSAIDAATNTITVQGPVPVVCELTAPGQSARDFAKGELVSCDVEAGSTFIPA